MRYIGFLLFLLISGCVEKEADASRNAMVDTRFFEMFFYVDDTLQDLVGVVLAPGQIIKLDFNFMNVDFDLPLVMDELASKFYFKDAVLNVSGSHHVITLTVVDFDSKLGDQFLHNCFSSVDMNGSCINFSILVSPENTAGVVLTFDDGKNIPEWHAILPLFDTYNVRATFFVSHFSKLVRGTNLEQQLSDIYNYGHEIAYHSVSHSRALEYIDLYGVDLYIQNEILADVLAMNAKGYELKTFAYPFGNNSDYTDLLLSLYFSKLRDVGGKYSNPFRYNDNLYFGISIDGTNLNYELLSGAMDSAVKQKRDLILVAHQIKDVADHNYYIKPDDLRSIIELALSKGLVFKRFSDID